MSLASRLSAFFLAALAVVLVGFSTALYALASDHLQRLLDERLDAALTTLAAAAEIGPGSVEWEPHERELGLGRDPGADQVRWVVLDDRGRPVDRSTNLNPRRLSPEWPAGRTSGRLLGRDGRPWRTKVRQLTPPALAVPARSGGTGLGPEPADEARSGHFYPALTLVAFAPLGPTEATLRSLALTLAVLSAALWGVAAVVGRRLCRQALAPLSRMATAARGSGAAEPGSRLPVPGSGDELEDLGHAFNGLLDRLHEALERQRRFAGDASHQLRTPLAGLLGQVEVALRRERPPEEYRRVLGLVRAKAAQLRQIVESLLFLARAEVEAGRPELEVVDLARWVPEHLRGWSAHPRAADLHATDDGRGPLWVRVHPPLLAQLVDNLVENACKYSPPGTPIVVRSWRESSAVALAVEDRGCGLSAEELGQVFEPFYRSPQARRRGQAGVGLGLAVARRIAAAFEGTIRVESQEGSGSRFEVRLPAAPWPPCPVERPLPSEGRGDRIPLPLPGGERAGVRGPTPSCEPADRPPLPSGERAGVRGMTVGPHPACVAPHPDPLPYGERGEAEDTLSREGYPAE
jgi:two-component system, OmpR family, sensor kinase